MKPIITPVTAEFIFKQFQFERTFCGVQLSDLGHLFRLGKACFRGVIVLEHVHITALDNGSMVSAQPTHLE